MTNENTQSEAFIGQLIAYLEHRTEQLQKAIDSLKGLKGVAEQFDPEHIQVMSRAIFERSLNSPHMTHHGEFVYALASEGRHSEDVLPPFDPDSPTRSPDEQEATHFQRIAGFFLKFKNRPSSTATVVLGSKLNRSAVATVLYTTHRDKFEKLKVGNSNRWHLKPDVYEQLEGEEKADEAPVDLQPKLRGK